MSVVSYLTSFYNARGVWLIILPIALIILSILAVVIPKIAPSPPSFPPLPILTTNSSNNTELVAIAWNERKISVEPETTRLTPVRLEVHIQSANVTNFNADLVAVTGTETLRKSRPQISQSIIGDVRIFQWNVTINRSSQIQTLNATLNAEMRYYVTNGNTLTFKFLEVPLTYEITRSDFYSSYYLAATFVGVVLGYTIVEGSDLHTKYTSKLLGGTMLAKIGGWIVVSFIVTAAAFLQFKQTFTLTGDAFQNILSAFLVGAVGDTTIGKLAESRA